MKKIFIKPKLIIANISPSGFYKYSKDFFNIGKLCEKRKKFSPVPYYLYCRSIELILKSFLLYKGISKSELKIKYSHDLIKILKKIELLLNKNLLNSKEKKTILKASYYYSNKNKGFEYFEVLNAVRGYKNLPDLLVLEKIVQKLFKVAKNLKIIQK